MTPDVFPIDWHSHREDLGDVLRNGTGVVHIEGADDTARIFVRTLTEVWFKEDCASADVVIVYIDPSDAKDLTPDGIAEKIIVEADLYDPRPTDVAADLSLFTGLTAGHDLNFTNNEVSVVLGSYANVTNSNPMPVISDGLGSFLKSRRLIVIFQEVHKVKPFRRQALQRSLWSKCLVAFQYSGVLAIFTFQDAKKILGDGAGFPPPATCSIKLTNGIPDHDQAGAVDDLVRISLDRGLHDTQSGAQVFADTIVRAVGSRSIPDMQNALHVFVAQKSLLRGQETP